MRNFFKNYSKNFIKGHQPTFFAAPYASLRARLALGGTGPSLRLYESSFGGSSKNCTMVDPIRIFDAIPSQSLDQVGNTTFRLGSKLPLVDRTSRKYYIVPLVTASLLASPGPEGASRLEIQSSHLELAQNKMPSSDLPLWTHGLEVGGQQNGLFSKKDKFYTAAKRMCNSFTTKPQSGGLAKEKNFLIKFIKSHKVYFQKSTLNTTSHIYIPTLRQSDAFATYLSVSQHPLGLKGLEWTSSQSANKFLKSIEVSSLDKSNRLVQPFTSFLTSNLLFEKQNILNIFQCPKRNSLRFLISSSLILFPTIRLRSVTLPPAYLFPTQPAASRHLQGGRVGNIYTKFRIPLVNSLWLAPKGLFRLAGRQATNIVSFLVNHFGDLDNVKWSSQFLFIPYTLFFGVFYTILNWQSSGGLLFSSIPTVGDYGLKGEKSITRPSVVGILEQKLEFTKELFKELSVYSYQDIFVRDTFLVSSQLSGQISTLRVATLRVAKRLKNYNLQGPLADVPLSAPYTAPKGGGKGDSFLFSFSYELLRLTYFSSKIFLLWGFFAIWKGVRPAKSIKNDFTIQARFLTPRKNKKRFSNLEGIDKFSYILKNIVTSLAASRSFDQVTPLAQLAQYLLAKRAGVLSLADKQGDLKASKHAQRSSSFEVAHSSVLFQPKGFLFIGPPGTGKTLLAQAVAGEARVNLICVSASEIQKQIDVGTRIGAIRLRNLFEQARKNAPCILFLDEIDSIGKARNIQETPLSPDRIWNFGEFTRSRSLEVGRGTGGQVSRNAPVNEDLKLFTEFLIQMDSFSLKDRFIVIGTTNFLSSLDSAFIRSGRFDRILNLQYPSKQTRISILKMYIGQTYSLAYSLAGVARLGGVTTTKRQFAASSQSSGVESIPWNYFSEITEGLSAADLAKVINESLLYSIEGSLRNEISLVKLTPWGSEGQVRPLWELGRGDHSKWQGAPLRGSFEPFRTGKALHTRESLKRGIKRIYHG